MHSLTETRLRKLVASHLSVDPDKIGAESSFVDDLGADSLDVIELQMAVEEEFNIEIPDDDAIAAFDVGGTFGKARELIDGILAKVTA